MRLRYYVKVWEKTQSTVNQNKASPPFASSSSRAPASRLTPVSDPAPVATRRARAVHVGAMEGPEGRPRPVRDRGGPCPGAHHGEPATGAVHDERRPRLGDEAQPLRQRREPDRGRRRANAARRLVTHGTVHHEVRRGEPAR